MPHAVRKRRRWYSPVLSGGAAVCRSNFFFEDTVQACRRVANGPDDPLFSASAMTAKSNSGFAANGFTRTLENHPTRLQNSGKTYEAASIPYYGPHTVRHMLARHATKNEIVVAELVAASQNLGHTEGLTTLNNYGQISREEQRKLITRNTSELN